MIFQIDFPSSAKAVKRRCFGQVFCVRENLLKKQVKSRFGHLLEIFDTKRVFLERAPTQNSICWRRRRIKKKFKVGRPKIDFLKSTKGWTLWVGRGSNSWGGGVVGVCPPLLPKSAPAYSTFKLSQNGSGSSYMDSNRL